MKWATPIWILKLKKLIINWMSIKRFMKIDSGCWKAVSPQGSLLLVIWLALIGTYSAYPSLVFECVLWCVYVAWYLLALVCACVCMCVTVHIDESTWGSQRSGWDGFLQTLFSFYLLFMKRTLSLNLKLAHGFGQAFQPMNFRNPFVSDAHHLRVPGTCCHTRLLI